MMKKSFLVNKLVDYKDIISCEIFSGWWRTTPEPKSSNVFTCMARRDEYELMSTF